MQFIAHRINTIEELKHVPQEFGVELDLRDQGDRLILQHDPFCDGEDFEDYLKAYNHGTMICNIKSERIETKVLELLKQYNIANYFFLDSSFPMVNLLANEGERNVALRFSEFESIETVLNMQGKVDWVWVDCFTKLPIDKDVCDRLKGAGFKLCLVSPELQGRLDELEGYKEILREEGVHMDAICTKLANVAKWQQ